MSDRKNRENRKTPIGSPYCSDPNCLYCKELQEVSEEVRKSNASLPSTVARHRGNRGLATAREIRAETAVDYMNMRKRLITPSPQDTGARNQDSLDLDRVASVEVTSEDKEYPVESALLSRGSGWRAASPGTQTIRLLFDQPQRLRRISLAFEENEIKRTQEFVLRWSADDGRSFREIVRQQWNFSPPDTASEVEVYQVEIPNVRILELIVVPDINGGAAHASLKSLRLS